MKKMFRMYMLKQDVESFKQLASLTGIKERNLEKKIVNPSMFRLYEIRALDEILHFSDEDMLKLVRETV